MVGFGNSASSSFATCIKDGKVNMTEFIKEFMKGIELLEKKKFIKVMKTIVEAAKQIPEVFKNCEGA